MRSPYYINQESNPAVLSTQKAIEHALHEEDVSLTIPDEHTGVTGLYPDNLRVNKIAYAVINQYDMPAVRTWYKYGQYEPYEELTPEGLSIGLVDELGEYVFSSRRSDLTVKDLVDYLREFDLKGIFEMDLFEFLKTNYEGFASDVFKPIYLSSTEIIRVLEEIADAPLGRVEHRIAEWRATVEREALDLKYWIKELEHFPSIVSERLSSFLTMLENALISLESATGEITEESYDALLSARETYHEYAWPFTAMHISLSEIEGPEDEVGGYKRRGESILRNLEKSSEIHLKGWKQELHENNLIPTLEQKRSLIQAGSEVTKLVDSGIGSRQG
jgi:hypothetical protein